MEALIIGLHSHRYQKWNIIKNTVGERKETTVTAVFLCNKQGLLNNVH